MTVYANTDGSALGLSGAFGNPLLALVPQIFAAGTTAQQSTLNFQLLQAQEEAKRTSIRAFAVVAGLGAVAVMTYFLLRK